MADSTGSADRLPSPDLSSLILEDYSQSLGCSPPMSSALNLDQKWDLSAAGFPAAIEQVSHTIDHLKPVALEDETCTSSRDAAVVSGVFGTGNGPEINMFGGFQFGSENVVQKSVNLTQDATGELGAGSISDCGEAGHLVDSLSVAALSTEANDYVMIEKESLDTWMSTDVDKKREGAAFVEARGNIVSSGGQEPEVLYTCVAALTGEETGGITVKEEPVDNSVSTDADENSEEESDSDATGTSESDTTSSSSDEDTEGDDDNTEEEDNEVDMDGEGKPNDLVKRPDCTMKGENNEHQDREMDGFEPEEANISSDEETDKEVKGPIKSKNELDALPPVPPVKVVLLPDHQTLPVGVVTSIVGTRVIVDGNAKHDPLNEGSILWITERKAPLGLVDEIFGPVKNPYYIVRYNLEEDIPLGIHVGTSVSFVAEFSTTILNQSALYKKGYDASGENDEELEEEVEFSDDEKEAEYRRSLRQYKRGMDGQNHGNQDRNKSQYRKASDHKQMKPNVARKTKKFIPAPHVSIQQRLPPPTGGSNAVSNVRPSNNYLGSGSTRVPPVSTSPHSHSSVGTQANLLSPLRSPWNPALPVPPQNVVSGNLVINGTLTQAGNSVMHRAMTPTVPPLQQAAGFLGGVTMNTLASQSMLTTHMQNALLSGGLFMNTNPFQVQPQLGNFPNILFQNQHQALQQFQQQQQQQQQQQSMPPFSYAFPTQTQFTSNQAPNVFPLNGQMNPSLGSMCFEASMQNNSVQVPFKHDNTSVAATNMYNEGQGGRNHHLPASNNRNVLPPTQFHSGTSSVRGRGAHFPRAKHPFNKRRP